MKSIGDPRSEWTSAEQSWLRSRAVIEGPGAAREHDKLISFNNLLVPFSVKMTQQQYELLLAEAELPCITAQFQKILVESLLRKRPTLSLKGNEQFENWILDEFGQDGAPIEPVIADALQEELATGFAWAFVDHPRVTEAMLEEMTTEERKNVRPYVVVRRAEEVINWQYGIDNTGRRQLLYVVIRTFVSKPVPGSVHPQVSEVIYKHFLDEQGEYSIEEFVGSERPEIPSTAGRAGDNKTGGGGYVSRGVIKITAVGTPLKYIPAWPLSANSDVITSPLMPIVEKEIALYNKMTRRNHLLYNASTFTPVVIGDISRENFNDVVDGGLGTWMLLPAGSSVDVLATPTAALGDYDRAIENALEEIAALGVRMLSPQSQKSGVALKIHNAAQTAQLGALNTDVANTWRQVIRCMIHWYTGVEPPLESITFSLSSDFLSSAQGEVLLRMVGDWCERGLIDRKLFIHVLNQNGLLPDGYNDEDAQKSLRNNTNFIPPIEP